MAGHSVRGLYTHLVCLREGQAALRSRWSLQILCLFLTCGLNAFLSPTHFIKKKSLCFAQAFLFDETAEQALPGFEPSSGYVRRGVTAVREASHPPPPHENPKKAKSPNLAIRILKDSFE